VHWDLSLATPSATRQLDAPTQANIPRYFTQAFGRVEDDSEQWELSLPPPQGGQTVRVHTDQSLS
jgi:hypothetical protein